METQEVVQQAEEIVRPQASPIRRMTPEEWGMVKEQSVAIAAAGGCLPEWIKNKYQVSFVVMKGFELGFAPLYSLEQIVMIKGKTAIQSQALNALIQNKHGRSAVEILERTNERVRVKFSDPRQPSAAPLIIEWTIADAKLAGLTGKPGPWTQYPRVMLTWRAIAEGARLYFSDTIAGLYLPDEVEGVQWSVKGDNIVIDGLVDEKPEAPAIAASEPVAKQDDQPDWDHIEVEDAEYVEHVAEPVIQQPVAPANPQTQDRPASPKHQETISKILHQLGKPHVNTSSMTAKEAEDMIVSLSREFNNKKKAETAPTSAPSTGPNHPVLVPTLRNLKALLSAKKLSVPRGFDINAMTEGQALAAIERIKSGGTFLAPAAPTTAEVGKPAPTVDQIVERATFIAQETEGNPNDIINMAMVEAQCTDVELTDANVPARRAIWNALLDLEEQAGCAPLG